MAALVCPNCRVGTSLYSSEQVEILYHSVFWRQDDGGVGMDYTGADTVTFDDGAEYRNRVVCRACLWEGPESRLVEAGEPDE